jgi:hypothetical protein
MAEKHDPVVAQDPELTEGLTFCVRHPTVETSLRCNKCGDPICVRCAVRTPVGYRCKTCIRQQQATFYTGSSVDYLIAGVVSLPMAAVGAYFVSFLGFFFAIFVSPVAGALVADAAWRAVGRRRSPNLWIIVCGGVILGTLGVALYQGGAFTGGVITSADFLRLDLGIYLFMALSAAYGRLRAG